MDSNELSVDEFTTVNGSLDSTKPVLCWRTTTFFVVVGTVVCMFDNNTLVFDLRAAIRNSLTYVWFVPELRNPTTERILSYARGLSSHGHKWWHRSSRNFRSLNFGMHFLCHKPRGKKKEKWKSIQKNQWQMECAKLQIINFHKKCFIQSCG